MKKVLQVVSCLEKGGTEAFIMNNYRAADKDRLQFDFFVFTKKDYEYIDEIKSLGGNVYFGVLPSIFRIPSFFAAIKKVLKNGNYDAVHCHVNSGNAIPILCARICGVKKLISHSHDTKALPSNFLKRLLFLIRRFIIKRTATHFFACSKDAGVSLYGEKFFDLHGTVINNGIDVDKFINVDRTCVNNLKKELCISEKAVVIGNITRFEPKKNQLFAVNVFFEILKYKPDSVLLLGGVDGGQLEEVKDRVKTLGIQDSVRFIGVRNDVPECLKLIDIYLFPSLYEGLGISLLEAQAAGCDCFASTGVSKESDMGIGNVCYFSLDDGEKQWADKILEKHGCFENISENAVKKAFIDKNYSIDSISETLTEVYYE